MERTANSAVPRTWMTGYPFSFFLIAVRCSLGDDDSAMGRPLRGVR
ncbi:MAG: hypothetical protein KGM60_09910 [Comamonadaceae bacterium]|nr:hypothetical protein [Comamonadaceae bacterium]